MHFLRHGQTDSNLRGLNCGGEWDVDLNETGRAQAAAFANTQKAFIETLEAVYVSPMRRTRQTAEIALTGSGITFEIIENLREWDVGNWSGHPIDETPDYCGLKLNPPGGEKWDDFSHRTLSTLQEVAHKPHKRILIVAHGGLWVAYAHHTAHNMLHLPNCTHEQLDRKRLQKYK